MALRFIIGRSGTGKTSFMKEQIKQDIKQNPFGPSIILLTPEQLSFQMEYGLIESDEIKGSLRAQGLSFRRLAYRVMQESGGTAYTSITDTGKSMLLYKLIADHEDELKLYQVQEGQTGFVEKMVSIFKEWKRYGVSSEQLTSFMKEHDKLDEKQLSDKLHDLTLMFSKLDYLMLNRYVDEEQQLRFLIDGASSASSLKGCDLWIDGFHGFTPLEYEALTALMGICSNIHISLTLDRIIGREEKLDELYLFHQTAETFKTITELAVSSGITIDAPVILQHHATSRFIQSPAIAFLEKNYQKRQVYEGELTNQIEVVAAVNRRAEVEAVARDMLKQVRENGYRWKDMAIVVRQLPHYQDYLAIAAKEYDIPIYMDMKQKPLYHPFIEFLRGVSETISTHWTYDAVFRMVKTEYLVPLQSDIPREWFDKLENYVLATGIQGYKWLDLKYWKPQAQVSLDEEEEYAYTITDEAQLEFNIACLTRECIVNPIINFDKQLKVAKNVEQQCLAIYELLMHLNIPYRLEQASEQAQMAGQIMIARTHKQLWAKVVQLLDEFVELCGDDKMSIEMFLGMFEAGLDSLTMVTIPPVLDQVMVGDMEHSRLENVKISYVLGATDGVMPMRMAEESLLTEREREKLAGSGLPMAPSSRRKLLDERLVIYMTLSKPSMKLWLSYPLADEEGKSIMPSEVIRQIKSHFPMLKVKTILAEPSLQMSVEDQQLYIAHPNKAMSSLIVMLRHWYTANDTIPTFWWDIYNWLAARPEYKTRLANMLMSLDYSNIEQPLLRETADQLFGSHLRMSVSRVERYVSCPFQHFSIYGLKLRKRKQYQIAAPDMGQLFHAALGKLTNELGHSFGRVNQDKVKASVDVIVEQLIPRLNSSILLSNERFKYIAKKLKQIVEQAAIMLNEHGGRTYFTPIGTEVDFGPQGDMPSLFISLEQNKQLEIIGRIDRIDSAQTDDGLLIRIMDYKSSDTALKLEQVVHGLSLQMLTYLDVLMTHGEGWLKQKVKPAGVLYFHVQNPILNVTSRISADEAAAAIFKSFKMRGLLLADSSVVRQMDTELDTGFSKMLPVAINKDETFRSGSSVISMEEWGVLRQFVRNKIKHIGNDIANGKLAIEPYQLGDKKPCQFCDYKSFCQFDQAIEGNEYRKLKKCDQTEVWQQLREGDSDESSTN